MVAAFASSTTTSGGGGGGAGERYTERSKGKDVRTSNIVAAKAVASAIRTSLGPRGMDKLIQLPKGGGGNSNSNVVISNDGATILSHMNVLHPAGKMLVELSKSQDIRAGDGTTSVVVLAGSLLEACDALLQKGIHPTQISNSFVRAAHHVCNSILPDGRCCKSVSSLQDRSSLLSAVETCLSSKVVSSSSDVLAPIAVDSVMSLLSEEQIAKASEDPDCIIDVDLRDVKIVKQVGGTVDDTELVLDGVVLGNQSARQTVSGAPTTVSNAKIGLIQYCLSAPKTDMDNNVVVSDYTAMDRILREERKYVLQQCKTIKKSGCNVLLIQKSILRDAYNEMSLHFLAKMNIMVITDVERSDVEYISRAVGCTPVANPDQWNESKLGSAESVASVFLEGASNRVVKITGIGPSPSSSFSSSTRPVTVLLRGSNDSVLQEAERSLHDAHCVVRSLLKVRKYIVGGGGPEMYASVQLKKHALSLPGTDSYCYQAFADALEVIPHTLAENAGSTKPIDIVTELRAKYSELPGAAEGEQDEGDTRYHAGINVKKGVVADDMYALNVIQPLLVSTSAITLATETVSMIMKVDDLIVVA